MRYLITKWFLPVLLGVSILLTVAPASAFDMFDINAPAIGENLSGGRPGNTSNWPADILQAIKADQIQAIEQMEQSGFSCWNVSRSVEGEVIDVKVKKGFFERLWDTILSFLKRLFGIAANRIDFSGSDVIFGPPCSCPPPPFEKDPVTGKLSVVKIFGILVEDLQYKKSVEAEVEAAFSWDFVGQGWNCTPGNPEGSRDPELSTTPQTPIPASLRNIPYPESLIARDRKGQIPAGEKFSGGKKFQFEATGSPEQIAEKAASELQTYLSEADESDSGFINKLIEKIKEIIFGPGAPRPGASLLEKLLDEHTKKLFGAGATCTQEVNRAFIPDDVSQRAFMECKDIINQKFDQCADEAGWMVDVLVGVKDLTTKPEQEESHEVVCFGGCPGEGAGDTKPLKIKSEFIDIQRDASGEEKEVAYEIVCSAACYSWECQGEPLPAVPVPVSPKLTPEPAPIPTPSSAPKPACDLNIFEPCANKCESPQACIDRCPFLPVECPPGTPSDVISCAELDQTCSYGCLNTANACLDDCLKLSRCTMEEIPPSLRPASK